MIKLHINSVEAQQHYLLVEELIQNRIGKIITNGASRKKVKVKASKALIDYLTALQTDSNLKQLITAEPVEIIKIIKDLRISNPSFFENSEDDNFLLRNIFIQGCYEHKSFSKLKFIKRIPIDTCPYCNRNYIYHLSKSGDIKPQIDHFYPKSIYPFLAASFYNLIPSCQTCNGFGAKEEKDPFTYNLVNPYLLDEKDFVFTYKIKSINFLDVMRDKKSIEIVFSNSIPGHVKVFKLDGLYFQHSDHVAELIIKGKCAYSSQYREYLKSYKDIKFSDHEINRMVLGNYSSSNDIHKRPLAKLYQDISKELGLIVD